MASPIRRLRFHLIAVYQRTRDVTYGTVGRYAELVGSMQLYNYLIISGY